MSDSIDYADMVRQPWEEVNFSMENGAIWLTRYVEERNKPARVERLKCTEKVNQYFILKYGDKAFPVKIDGNYVTCGFDNGDTIYIPETSRGELRIPRKEVKGL